MDRLVSKIFAGGISAGMFLIWWPQHVHSEDLAHLVVRGLLWTLTFELLLVSFGPAEDAVRARVTRRLEKRRGLVRLRLDAVPAPARAGGTLALACMGLALPAVLLAGGPTELVEAEDGRKVVKQVVVERPVIEKKVVVRRVVERTPLRSSGASPSIAQTTPVTVAAPAAARPKPQARTKVVTEKASELRPTTAKAAPKAQPTRTTSAAPAATTTTSDTAAATTPAAASATDPAPAATTTQP